MISITSTPGPAVVEYNLPIPYTFDQTGFSFVHVHEQSAHPYVRVYLIPEQPPAEAPDLVRKLHELVRWTGWSHRELAQISDSTHPTIAEALKGKPGALSRSDSQRQRLDDAYEVVSRIHVLAGRSADRTAAILGTLGPDGVTAAQWLSRGQPTKAYIVAMRALHPPQPGEMMVGSHPMDPRRASHAISEEG